jgi:DNA-binding PadR family transcriptional regulator
MIQQQSDDVFLVDHGSLYLALQRLEDKGLVAAKWGTSDTNRRARFYTLTAKGRRQLTDRTAHWRRIAGAVARILGPEESEA